jgi:hypothetical protein
MNDKFLNIISILCVVASVGMYVVGSNSGHLSELQDFFWVPLPLGIGTFLLAKKKEG